MSLGLQQSRILERSDMLHFCIWSLITSSSGAGCLSQNEVRVQGVVTRGLCNVKRLLGFADIVVPTLDGHC